MEPTSEIFSACEQAAAAKFGCEGSARGAMEAAVYVAHVGGGASYGELAEVTGRHPTTVMRMIRKLEDRRDDPLYDSALTELTGAVCASVEVETEQAGLELKQSGVAQNRRYEPKEGQITSEALRILRRLTERGAFMLVAVGAEKAGVFCAKNQFRRPLAMVRRDIARVFAVREWIKCKSSNEKSARYELSDVGRAWLKRQLAAEAPTPASGFAEAPSPFAQQHRLPGVKEITPPGDDKPRKMSVNLGETPLGWLARRKGPDGAPFLQPEEVEAGERLREEFEKAQMGPRVAQDWDRFLTAGASGGSAGGGAFLDGPAGARKRVAEALQALGPGLSDIALRSCCFLEGLEATEKRMGWSARSGKVVLKISLQRLVDHYGLLGEAQARGNPVS